MVLEQDGIDSNTLHIYIRRKAAHKDRPPHPRKKKSSRRDERVSIYLAVCAQGEHHFIALLLKHSMNGINILSAIMCLPPSEVRLVYLPSGCRSNGEEGGARTASNIRYFLVDAPRACIWEQGKEDSQSGGFCSRYN